MATTALSPARPSVIATDDAPVMRSFSPMISLADAPSVSVIEVLASPGEEPPMHVHANEDEVFYVLEGELTVWVAGEEHRARAGTCAVLPRGLPHTFAVDTDRALMLVICAPGGFPAMFGELPAPVDMALAEEIFERYGVSVVGPNPRHC